MVFLFLNFFDHTKMCIFLVNCRHRLDALGKYFVHCSPFAMFRLLSTNAAQQKRNGNKNEMQMKYLWWNGFQSFHAEPCRIIIVFCSLFFFWYPALVADFTFNEKCQRQMSKRRFGFLVYLQCKNEWTSQAFQWLSIVLRYCCHMLSTEIIIKIILFRSVPNATSFIFIIHTPPYGSNLLLHQINWYIKMYILYFR